MTNRKRLFKTRSQSLSFNFISKTVLILLAIQIGSAFFIHHNQSAKISHDMSVRGQGLADSFASISSEFIISYNMMALDNIVTNLKEQEGVKHAVFYDESQSPLTTSDGNIDLIDTKEFKADVVFEEMTLGSFSIWLSTESEKKALNTLIIMLSISTALVVLLLVFALLYLFKVQVIKPLAKIGRHAEAIATGDLNREIVVDRGDEIGNLLVSFDHMLDNFKLKAEEAENIANGFLDEELSLASDEDVLGKAFIKVQENLKKLVEQMETISDSAQDGYLHIRGNVDQFSGKYNEMIKAVNRLADTLVDHIDQVPSPVFLIDTEFNIKFMNQYGADLCGKEKAEMVGTKCFDHFNTAHCKTENCACFQAMKNKEEVTSEVQAHLPDQTLDIKYTGKPIYDGDGGVNGAIEIITDQTDIIAIQKKTVKISDYQATEITKLSSTLEKMSEGDLSVSYEMEPSDDDTQEVYNSFVLLSKAFNKTLHGLNDILGRVNQTVGQVNQGATQVSSASQSLSQQATEQASSLEEVSSSLQEISSQTQSNAESAEHANRLSISAGEVAETGNSRMKDMLQAMGDINTSSHEIKKIIKVIDEIAFQTNLLALNAAVEAARAGVHGKGFAVVAEEVRNLAKRSATAARETTQLIEDSVGKAENGGQIAGETAEALEKIEEHVNKVADLIGEINAGSKEQNHALKEITEALTQIDQITQSNTANAEQSASASEELAGQSEELREMLSSLKLKEDRGQFRRETKRRPMLNGHKREVLFDKNDLKPEAFVTPEQIIDLEDTDFSNF